MRRLPKLLLVPFAAGVLAVAAPALAQESQAHPTHPAQPQHAQPAPKVAEKKAEGKKADPKGAQHAHPRTTARAEERANHAREVAAFHKSADAEKQRHTDKLQKLRQEKRRVDKAKDKGWKANMDQQNRAGARASQAMAEGAQGSGGSLAPLSLRARPPLG